MTDQNAKLRNDGLPVYTPFGYWTFAKEYATAAHLVWENKNGSAASCMPAFYLGAMAIEQFLKSYLLAKGDTKNQVRKLGHCLVDASSRAFDLGLDLTPMVDSDIQLMLQKLDVARGGGDDLRYFNAQLISLPVWTGIYLMMFHLERAIRPVAETASFTETEIAELKQKGGWPSPSDEDGDGTLSLESTHGAP